MANRNSQPTPEGQPSQPRPRTGAKPADAADTDAGAGGFVERKYEESTYPETGLGNGDDPKTPQADDRMNDKIRHAATRKGVK